MKALAFLSDFATLKKTVFPIVVLAGCILIAMMIMSNPPEVEQIVRERVLPTVKVLSAYPEMVQLMVKSQGTVTPQTEVSLVAEVNGRVTHVAPSFINGGYFNEGDLLMSIDPTEYDLNIIKARAKVKEAKSSFRKIQADMKLRRQTALVKAQLEQARAAVEAAKASLQEAELKRKRTDLHAPFNGRVKSTQVNISQYVGVGQEVARIYSVGVAEVRLPISDEQLAYLKLPMHRRVENGPLVTIFGRVANRKYQWRGRIVRTEASIDTKSRVMYAVVQVTNPDEQSSGLPSLNVGMYVNVDIQGRQYRNIYVLPRKSVKQGKRVMVIDDDQRLHFRDVKLLRDEKDRMLIERGLKPGEKVVISPLETPIENMQVQIYGQDKQTSQSE